MVGVLKLEQLNSLPVQMRVRIMLYAEMRVKCKGYLRIENGSFPLSISKLLLLHLGRSTVNFLVLRLSKTG